MLLEQILKYAVDAARPPGITTPRIRRQLPSRADRRRGFLEAVERLATSGD